MAIRGGPDIIEDGLVLHLDAAEPLCFRGEPTTNVVANSVPNANWFVGNYGGSTVTRSYLIEDNIPFMRFSNVNVPAGGTYPRINNSSMTSTITGTFSASLEARGTEGAVVNFSIYSSGSTRVSFAVTLTSEWTRYEFTTTTAYNLDMPYFQPRVTGATYDVRNIQIEAKPYSTPFVAGTRGSTVATGGGLLDLTNNGNNGTITRAASPSAGFYDSNNGGSFVFDGANDYVNLGNILNFNYTDSFTLSAWIKRSSTGTGVQNIISKQSMSSPYQGYQFGFNVNTGGSQGYLGVNTIGNYPSHAMGIQTQTTYNDTNWHYVVATYNGNGSYTGFKLYVEGELKTSSYHYIGTSSVSFSNSKNLQIAARDGVNQLFSGNIPQILIYNKTLSANEVQQNYNATKGRFGL